VFLAQLDAQFAKKAPRGFLAGFRSRPRLLRGYKVFAGKLNVPSDDWFTAEALRAFTTRAYRVSSASNRIGLRTEGPALERAVHGELPSEGMVLGAVQVPPDGRPVVFLADHPTTGGYPVIGVVRAADLPAVAQAVPGTPVRFMAVRRR